MSVTHHLHFHRHTPTRAKPQPVSIPGAPTATGGVVLATAFAVALAGWAFGLFQIISAPKGANVELWTALALGSALAIFVSFIWKSFRA